MPTVEQASSSGGRVGVLPKSRFARRARKQSQAVRNNLECQAVRVRTQVAKTAAALFGETPLGIVGAGLQWLTLAILVVVGVPDVSLPWRLAIAPLGLLTLLAGIMLAFRGKSLGPIIVIPVVLGIAMILLLTAIFYPLRFLTSDDSREADHSTNEH